MLLTSFFRTFESGLAIPRPTTDLSSFQAEMSSVTCNCNSYGTCPYDPPRLMPNFVLKSKSETKRQLSKVDLGSMTRCSTESAQERFSSRFCCLDENLVLEGKCCGFSPRSQIGSVPPVDRQMATVSDLSNNLCPIEHKYLPREGRGLPPEGSHRYEIGTHSA